MTLHKKKRIAFYAFLVLIAALIATIWGYRIEEQNAYRLATPEKVTPVNVTTAIVRKGAITKWVVGEGYAEATRKAHLQFEESGRVVLIARDAKGNPLKEGAPVMGPITGAKHGQVIARIDSRDKYSDIQQSRAALEEAEKEVEVQRAAHKQAQIDAIEAENDAKRKKRLFDKNYLAQSDYDQAHNKYKNALSAVKMAKNRVASARSRFRIATTNWEKSTRGPEKVTLYAPFSGIIARLNIHQNDYFDPTSVNHETKANLLDTAPVTIIDPTQMEITLHMPQFSGKYVRQGQKVIITPAAESWAPDTTLENTDQITGTVYSVSPQIDATRRAIRVKIRLTQQATTIPDGMYVSCWIAVTHKTQATRIPLSCLLFRGSIPYVYIAKDGTAIRQNITLGIKDTRYAEVINGIPPETVVICKGRTKITHGTAIRIVSNEIATRRTARHKGQNTDLNTADSTDKSYAR